MEQSELNSIPNASQHGADIRTLRSQQSWLQFCRFTYCAFMDTLGCGLVLMHILGHHYCCILACYTSSIFCQPASYTCCTHHTHLLLSMLIELSHSAVCCGQKHRISSHPHNCTYVCTYVHMYVCTTKKQAVHIWHCLGLYAACTMKAICPHL